MFLQIRSPADQIKTVPFAAAVATTAHTPVLINGHVFIPTSTQLAGATNGFVYGCQFSDAPKAAVAWNFGDKLYWDNTNNVITNVAAGNTLIGYALASAAAGDATVSYVDFNAFAV